MEWLKNLFSPVSERVKSPFYGAFVVSWLIVNWKIVYAIFTNDQLIEGLTRFEFIKNELTLCGQVRWWGGLHLFVIPILIAVSYIYLVPWIDERIFPYIENNRRRRIDKRNEITRQHTVSGNRYVDLLLVHDKQKSELSELDSKLLIKEGEIITKQNKLDELEGSLEKRKEDYSKTIKENQSLKTSNRRFSIEKLADIFNGQIFNYYWRYGIDGELTNQKFKIDSENILTVFGSTPSDLISYYKIVSVKFNQETRMLTFAKLGINTEEAFFVNLKASNNELYFEGVEIMYAADTERIRNVEYTMS